MSSNSWQDTQVSMFANALKSTAPRNATIGSILADIQSGKWARQIETIRAIYAEACVMEGPEEAKKAINELKKKLPGFLASGVFSKRANDQLNVPSGLMCIDLDNQNDDAIRATLEGDPYVAADWTSPSGSGLKIITRIRPDASLYLRSFQAARIHFASLGLVIDESCKDPARLCFVSHDSQLFMRNGETQILEPLPLEPEPEPEPEPKPEKLAKERDDVELTLELETRIKFYLKKVDPAIEGQHGSNLTFRVASALVWGFALSFDDAKVFMRSYSERCQPPWSDEEIDHKLEDARKPEKHQGRKPRGYLLDPPEADDDDDVVTPDPFSDSRRKIEMAGSRNRLLSDFAKDLAPVLTATHAFFVKDRLLMQPDGEKAELRVVDSAELRTAIEKHVIPWKLRIGSGGREFRTHRTIPGEDASGLVVSSQLLESLPKIRLVNNARFPVKRRDGRIELLSEGYDRESETFTCEGGPTIVEMSAEAAKQYLVSFFDEFPFLEGDKERAISVVVSAMLTLFVANVLPRGILRPGYLSTANAEGAGKTLLLKLAVIPALGYSSNCSPPEREEEIRKAVFASALAARPVFFYDNLKKHFSSPAVEGLITTTFVEDRVLGRSEIVRAENLMTVFLSGNGATVSPDMRRRLLHVDLFLKESRSEDHEIENFLGDKAIIAERAKMCSALWALVSDWSKHDQPEPSALMPGFEEWAQVVGGILEHHRFVSPYSAPPGGASKSGDTDTEDMEKLVAALHARKKQVSFAQLLALCYELGLFSRLIGEDCHEEIEKGSKLKFGKILARFDQRIFRCRAIFYAPRNAGGRTYFWAASL